MTIYTKEQIESKTLSALELVRSWTCGQGNPTASELYTKNLQEVERFLAARKMEDMQLVLQARGIIDLMKQGLTEKSKTAFIAGYAGGPNHFDQYNKAISAKKAEPLVGHYLTAADYLQSCYDLLPPLPVPTFEDILSSLNGYKASMNKTELVQIIENVISLCTPQSYTTANLTAEQLAKYTDLTVKEETLAFASHALSVYLEDIKPISDTTLQGKFRPETGTGALLNQLITEEKYKILVTTPIPAKLDESFNVVEPSYILFSIQVITL